ncbi:MAG: DUF3054 domain-containing protein [Acidobacteriota bacterium]|nr:DUF3054 domain-containing protein [Acidobacteriota bacterium]MDE3191772.1 DUF3054 domain-containing protein [Acidobacteriota bacterium]
MRRVPAAVVDGAALVVFVSVGVATHGASAGAFFRDLACILGGWFAAAAAVRLYARGARGGRWRLGATWLAGVSAGVLVRAAFVGHVAVDFWGVALAFTALFLLAARLTTHVLARHVGGLAP